MRMKANYNKYYIFVVYNMRYVTINCKNYFIRAIIWDLKKK